MLVSTALRSKLSGHDVAWLIDFDLACMKIGIKWEADTAARLTGM
jgi:hypothetical protein